MRLPDLVRNWVKEHQHKTNDRQSKRAKIKTRRAHLRNLQRAVKSYLDRLEILRTENKRLREALEKIASDKPIHDGFTSKAQNEIARAALEGK